VLAAPLAALTLLAAAAPPPAAFDPADPPAVLGKAVRRADAAVEALRARLQARLGKALAEGGLGAAVSVCRDEAPRIAAEVGAETGVRIGRTSDRLRNPGNAAPAWASAAVSAGAGRKAVDVKPQALDLGDRVGLLRPIAFGPACGRCHGKAEALAPEVASALKAAYPADRATGYDAGDHRGFFWVEAPR
jgi:hypothetical protein